MTSDDPVFDYAAEDLNPATSPSDDALHQLRHLAAEQMRLEGEIAEIEAQLAEKQTEHKQISQRDIPDLMKAAKVKKFTLDDGTEITLKDSLKAGLYENPEQRTAQIAWLDSHGMSAIVKRQIGLRFSREDAALMAKVKQRIAAEFAGVEVSEKFDVHNGQLVAGIKQLRKDGVDVPTKLFQIFEIKQAKIDRPKK